MVSRNGKSVKITLPRWLLSIGVFFLVMLIARSFGIGPTLAESVTVTIATTLMIVVMDA